MSVKGLICKIHRKLNHKKSNNWIKKYINGYFSEDVIQMANKYMKKKSKSLVIREMQIKTILWYHLIPVKLATIIKKKMINIGGDVEKRNPWKLLVGMYSHYRKQYGVSSKNIIIPTSPLSKVKEVITSTRYLHSYVIAALFIVDKRNNQLSMYQQMRE